MSNEADITEWEPAWRTMPAGLVFGAVGCSPRRRS